MYALALGLVIPAQQNMPADTGTVQPRCDVLAPVACGLCMLCKASLVQPFMCCAMLCCRVQYVPLEEGRYSITPDLARELVDENTIGVVGILGSTYNGEFEDIKGLNDMVGESAGQLPQ